MRRMVHGHDTPKTRLVDYDAEGHSGTVTKGTED
jgi:hypothetical protein